MRKIILVLTILLVGSQAFAQQKVAIRGIVGDTTRSPLPSATLLILNPSDSSLLNFGITLPDGSFEIRNIPRQSIIVKVTFVGYQPYTKLIAPTDQDVRDLGFIRMLPETRQLSEVEILGKNDPVTIKKDTIEFNATVFKTKENAVVEDLLKKLPGVEVDNDGTIRAQGEQVNRVMVDGKNFFGSDPKLATRNLPADAIKKVQVFDKKSDQAVFSGIDDGQREKTINLELKEEKRKGMFGNITGGIGNNDRYTGKLSLNRFRKQHQLSILGMSNNINERGFGIDDYMTFTGGAQQMMSGRGNVRIEVGGSGGSSIPLNIGGRSSGIMTSHAGGINFNQTINSKTELASSYFYNHLDHVLGQTTDRTNILPSGNLIYNQKATQNNLNDNHRVNLQLDHKLDSTNSIKLTAMVTSNFTESQEESSGSNKRENGTLTNENTRATYSAGTTNLLNSTLLWRHRFNKKGRTLSVTGSYNVSETNRDGLLTSVNTFYGNTVTTQNTDQENSQNTMNNTLSAGFSYTEPLGNRRYLEANYTYRVNTNDVTRSVYDNTPEGPVFNASLSNKYTSAFTFSRPGLNFRMNRQNYSVTAGVSYQDTRLNGDLILLSTKINRSYQNILPVVRFNYDFSSTRHLTLDAETSVQEPTIQQLQPIVDNSDPLNLYQGNPDLRPGYSNSARLNFTAFDPARFVNLFTFINATYTKNAIVTSQSTNAQGVRLSKPVNVAGNLRVSGNVAFGFPIDKISSRFNVSGNVSYQNSSNVVNETTTDILQNSYGLRLRYELRLKDYFELSLSTNVSRVSTSYEFNSAADQLYFNNTHSADANLTIRKKYQIGGDFEFLDYKSVTTDYRQTIPLLNLSISRFILKANAGQLKFSVQNVLDKNIGISQSADINYIERVQSNNLGRYYLLTFTYALNRQLNPMGGGRGRGGMRMIQIQD